MLLIPIVVPPLKQGDDLAEILHSAIESNGSVSLASDGPPLRAGDIFVISAKAAAAVEGAAIDLRALTPSPSAADFNRRTGRSTRFCEAMILELNRLHGKVLGAVPGAALTEVKPDGLARGSILVANAGLDESNAPAGFAIGWPRDPVASARKLRKALEKRMQNDEYEGRNIAVILSDSCCVPRRSGVTAMALTVSGMDPLQSQKGRKDLFGKPLHITVEAVADQLATAANFLMGNAGQAIPAVIIRDHGLTLSEWEGWAPGIEAEEDLFGGTLS